MFTSSTGLANINQAMTDSDQKHQHHHIHQQQHQSIAKQSPISSINRTLFDGDHNYDQICCKVAKQNLSVKELNDDVERRDDILLIHK